MLGIENVLTLCLFDVAYFDINHDIICYMILCLLPRKNIFALKQVEFRPASKSPVGLPQAFLSKHYFKLVFDVIWHLNFSAAALACSSVVMFSEVLSF